MLARRVRNGDRPTAGQGSGRVAGHRPDAVRRRNCGTGWIRRTSRAPVAASRARAGRRSTKFCNDWSRYDACPPRRPPPTAEAVLDEIERVVVGKRAALTLILTTVLARGHVLIEDLPGLGKTLIARSFAAALGLGLHPCAVHAGSAARRPARLDRLRHAVGPLRIPSRTHLHQPAPRRRDQPDATQDPGGAAGGDGRRTGQYRRRNPQAACAVHRSGHRQPHRV